MVEIGKRDFIGQGRLDMESFEGNRAVFGVEMWPIFVKQPHRIRKLSEQFLGYYRTGALPPIRPVQLFESTDIEAALRTMERGQHIGKLVVRIPEDAYKIIAKPTRRGVLFRPDASYLLAGGLGGLGRSLAMWMVERGARHLVFLSRSGGSKPHEEAFARGLRDSGCTVDMVKGSVTGLDDVVRAVNQAPKPIAGVVQLSMVLRDHLFADMSFEDWETVIAPKVQSTWNLHTALAKQKLDFFVMFSSFTGVVGQRGQGNYAAAVSRLLRSIPPRSRSPHICGRHGHCRRCGFCVRVTGPGTVLQDDVNPLAT
jgi:hypothetical protein